MSLVENPLVFAIQGTELSYHAVAAKALAGDAPIHLEPMREFGDVVRASRLPGVLGVIAMCTVAGTVDDSAREIVSARPSAVPWVIDRVDIPVPLSLMGPADDPIDFEAGRPHNIRVLAQKAAYLQCEPTLKVITRNHGVDFRGESIEAIQEAFRHDKVRRSGRRWVGIGPTHAAEALGAAILGPQQINPPNSVTSFYALQADPRREYLPHDKEKTVERAVISVAHPEGEGEFEKCIAIMERLGIGICRFIPFDIGDFTKHRNDVQRGGGIFELDHGIFETYELCARINALGDNGDVQGPFNAAKLGHYYWYDEPALDPNTIVAEQAAREVATRAARQQERAEQKAKAAKKALTLLFSDTNVWDTP